ncbi:MAG: glycoside hydrolase family 2 TIM barrel-domain containing protein [Planctomycetota bacterium]|nr:glycoside hydrolase family 2 TIM barrel-domain containing protein [Planctomycetota bacterium]
MKKIYDLSTLDWTLAGYTPHVWRQETSMETAQAPKADIPPLPAQVPGSVQQALLDAGVIPDWNIGLNARQCEWVENRHWIYQTEIPTEWIVPGMSARLRCLGLDYSGVIRLNGEEVFSFRNSMLPHVVDLPLTEAGSTLQIIFECPPRWLGTPGWTSRVKDWKPRFNYHWDWINRMVQIGIWDEAFIEVLDDSEILDLKILTDFDTQTEQGKLRLSGTATGGEGCTVRATLSDGSSVVFSDETPLTEFLARGFVWDSLDVDPWWPNGMGEQPLYLLVTQLLDSEGRELDKVERRIGFKNIRWEPCAGAPSEADPWLCVVNGQQVFLQGINWSPIRPNFADVTTADYRKRLELYRDLHMNAFRINGVGILEKECFFDLCDELGLMVWAEFPLSCSGMDNYPPEDETSIAEMEEIARSYIARRQHHASLLLWCGGNELMDEMKPLDESHPMLGRLGELVRELDPGRRYLPCSASGPTFYCGTGRRDDGVHWDVHGPWQIMDSTVETWRQDYWEGDDALFRSEVGAPGPSPAELTRKYKGDLDEMPASLDNPLWRRTPWWIEWPEFIKEKEREPEDLEEFVAWGQERQAIALRIAAETCKTRFPACGGILIWHGHDCFPCTANTAIVDFDGNPKPAAIALGEVFAGPSGEQC